jgi:hypothetical protein
VKSKKKEEGCAEYTNEQVASLGTPLSMPPTKDTLRKAPARTLTRRTVQPPFGSSDDILALLHGSPVIEQGNDVLTSAQRITTYLEGGSAPQTSPSLFNVGENDKIKRIKNKTEKGRKGCLEAAGVEAAV